MLEFNGVIVLFGGSIILFVIYVSKIPFFEQWRSDDVPWPWESKSKEEWRKSLRRSISFNLFNACLMAPLTTFVMDKIGIPMEHFSSIDRLPSIS